MEEFLIKILSIGSLVISAIIISFILSLIFRSHGFYVSFFKKYGFKTILVISFVATVGSLVMSFLWKLPPCDLCWYQRMFMYPIFLISAYALYKKDYKNGSMYCLIMATLGFVIASYHYLIQMINSLKNTLEFCSTTSVDCSVPDFVQFGFVTTPFISLVAFLIIIISAIYATRNN